MSIIRFPERRRRPPPEIYVAPDDMNGGCWAVHLVSAWEDGASPLGRHFNLDDAIAAARAAAKQYGAVFVDDDGGNAA